MREEQPRDHDQQPSDAAGGGPIRFRRVDAAPPADPTPIEPAAELHAPEHQPTEADPPDIDAPLAAEDLGHDGPGDGCGVVAHEPAFEPMGTEHAGDAESDAITEAEPVGDAAEPSAGEATHAEVYAPPEQQHAPDAHAEEHPLSLIEAELALLDASAAIAAAASTEQEAESPAQADPAEIAMYDEEPPPSSEATEAGEAMSSAAELVDFLAADLAEMAGEFDRFAADLESGASKAALRRASDLATSLGRLAMFFGHDRLGELGAAVQSAADAVRRRTQGDALRHITQRVRALAVLLRTPQHASDPSSWSLTLLRSRLEAAAGGATEEAPLDDTLALLLHDGVVATIHASASPEAAGDEWPPSNPIAPLDDAEPLRPDPTVPLDPTAGMVLDPNVPLDPTGGGFFDPNVPLDPSGGMAPSPLDAAGADEQWGTMPLIVSPEEAEALQAAMPAVRQAVEEIAPILNEASEFTGRLDAAPRLSALGASIRQIADRFELRSMVTLAEFMETIGSRLAEIDDAVAPELFLRVRTIGELLDQYCSALEVGMEIRWPLGTLRRRIDLLLSGKRLHPDLIAWHRGDLSRVIELDGIAEGVEALPTPDSEIDESLSAGAGSSSSASSGGEQTIRVTRATIEELLDLVRQLVLNKNQVQSLAEAARSGSLDAQGIDLLAVRSVEYGRLVGRLQESVAIARFLPIGRILDRFRRTVRDISQLNDRDVNYVLSGEDTGVDKFVLDALAEPLGRILRHAASRSIETQSRRRDAGKPATGTLAVHAEDLGSHISVAITDDGSGASRDDLIERASAFGHVTPEALAAMPEEALARLAFEAWHADSDLAGVADALRAMEATLRVTHTPGRGSRVEILLPVKGAVIEAMRVLIGGEVYAVPVQSVVQIVREEDVAGHSIGRRPVIRLRERIIPVVDSHDVLSTPDSPGPRTLVIVGVEGRSAALRVDRVLGYQEVVIDQTGLDSAEQGPFLGATIQDNGRVAFVIDVARLTREHALPNADRTATPDETHAHLV